MAKLPSPQSLIVWISRYGDEVELWTTKPVYEGEETGWYHSLELSLNLCLEDARKLRLVPRRNGALRKVRLMAEVLEEIGPPEDDK